MSHMVSKGRQRQHLNGGLDCGVLNKQMTIRLIQELGIVYQ